MTASDGGQTLCAECGRRLRARREALGLLQKDVAVAVGRSTAAIGAQERGENWLAPDVLFAYCRFVELPYHLMLPWETDTVLGQLWALLLEASPDVHESFLALLRLPRRRAKRHRSSGP